jgi:predicted nucleic-acid-binding Zn-ribbon protein
MLRNLTCPKCSHEMDEGTLGEEKSPNYLSAKVSRPFIGKYVPVALARACPACGYVELYLDPQRLAKALGA